jgi:hypothetical protein
MPRRPYDIHTETKKFKKIAIPLSKEILEQLAQEATQGLINNNTDSKRTVVYFKFHYLTDFPEGFPKGVVRDFDGEYCTRSVVCQEVLDWLFKNSHCKYDYKSLMVCVTRVNKMFDIGDLLEYDGYINNQQGEDNGTEDE